MNQFYGLAIIVLVISNVITYRKYLEIKGGSK